MPILQFILILVAIGVIMWAVNAYIPMEAGIKKVLNIVVLIVVILWVLQLFGLFAPLSAFRVGPIR